MQFAVDAHAIGLRQTGNEVYIRNLLQQFATIDSEAEFTAYVSSSRAARQIPASFRHQCVSTNPCRRLGLDLPARVRTDRPNLVHVQYTAPLSVQAPVVATVHDVSFLECPQFFSRTRALQLRLTVRRTVEKAARVITVSDFSRRAILHHYDIDPQKVVMIPNAVSNAFRPMNRKAAQRRIEGAYGIRGPFVLTVGDLQPRKNHLGLLAAFESLLASHPELPHRLVFVGKDTWSSKPLHRAAQRSPFHDRIHFTGFVEDTDLVNFYGACDLVVFPSFYEGFGLPILEAMASGRAIACSNTTAMPEVADGAGVLFDPHSRWEMTRAMSQVLRNAELRAQLERRGIQRAKLFSWQRSARLTLEVYYQVAGVSRRFHDDADRLLLPTAAC